MRTARSPSGQGVASPHRQQGTAATGHFRPSPGQQQAQQQQTMTSHMPSSLSMQPTAPMFPTSLGQVHGPGAFQDPAIAAATPAFAVSLHAPVDHGARVQQHQVVGPGPGMDMSGAHGQHATFAGLPSGHMAGMHESHPFMMSGGEQGSGENHNAPENAQGGVQKRMVVDPPNLEEWRQRLFDCDELIIVTNDQ